MKIVYQVILPSKFNNRCDDRDEVIIEYNSKKEAMQFIEYRMNYDCQDKDYYIRKIYRKQ